MTIKKLKWTTVATFQLRLIKFVNFFVFIKNNNVFKAVYNFEIPNTH